jgi:hypothetical protein
MPDLTLSLQTHPVLFIVLTVLIAVISYIVYRVTVPPIPGALKTVLILLRTVGIAAVLLIFFEPVVTVATRIETPQRIGLIIDDSRSMQLVDGSGDRKDAVRAIISGDRIQDLYTQGHIAPYRFSNTADLIQRFHPDTIQFEGEATNIYEAFRALRGNLDPENIKLAVLISDGNYNVGPRPVYEAEQLGIPVITVGVGDTLEQRDILINRVLYNDVAYLDTESPVDVRIKSSGYGGERVLVRLSDEEGMLEEQHIILEEGTAEYDVSFSYEPRTEGTHRYTVSIQELPEEVTYENNRRSFYVRVLDRKTQVLIIGGAPSQDIAFLRRSLENDETVTVTMAVQRLGSDFYGVRPTDELLRRADLMILAGFPRQDTDRQIIELIKRVVNEERKPILFIESSGVYPQSAEEILPVTITGYRREELSSFLHAPDTQETHPLLRVDRDRVRPEWNQLPPVFRSATRYIPQPGSETVLLHRSQHIVTDEPFLVIRSIGGRKSAAVLAYGVWRWRMLGRVAVDGEKLYNAFFENLVQWLTADEDDEHVRIVTSEDMYTTGEQIDFIAQVYDEQYRPFSNAEIRINVRSGESTYETILTPAGHGRYEGSLNPLREGDYSFTGTAQYAGSTVGTDDGRFVVGELNIEFRDTRMNAGLLRQLAAVTGGQYVHVSEAEKFDEILRENSSFEPRITARTRDYQVWNLPSALAVMVFVFSLEWLLRKRNGML